jgi:hypothetical protein
MEYFPQIVSKWQAKGSQNHNQNQNVQNISAEKWNKGPIIVVVTHRGARIWVDMKKGGNHTKKWVRKSAGPMPNFYPRKERETYHKMRKEVLG